MMTLAKDLKMQTKMIAITQLIMTKNASHALKCKIIFFDSLILEVYSFSLIIF